MGIQQQEQSTESPAHGDLALQKRRLWGPDPMARLQAATDLAPFGAPAVELLGGVLRGGPDTAVRRAAIDSLEEIGGPDAQEELCRALADPEPKLRAAAARALGRSGDQGCIPALTEALRGCFVQGSARRQWWIGIAVAVGAALLCGGIIYGSAALRMGAFTFLAFQFLSKPFDMYFKRRRKQSELCRAITEALVQIGERHPTPELRAVLPDLNAVADDLLQQEGETRAASRAAATRIRELTESLKSLPIAARPATPEPGSLPRPADPGYARGGDRD